MEEQSHLNFFPLPTTFYRPTDKCMFKITAKEVFAMGQAATLARKVVSECGIGWKQSGCTIEGAAVARSFSVRKGSDSLTVARTQQAPTPLRISRAQWKNFEIETTEENKIEAFINCRVPLIKITATLRKCSGFLEGRKSYTFWVRAIGTPTL